MFSWEEQYLTSERSERVRYCSCQSNIKFISSRHRVISSIFFISSVLYKHVKHFPFHKYRFFWNSSPWCAAPTSDKRSQHLQVDLLTIHTVSAVSTQGAITESSWVSSYLVHYSLDGNEWIVLTDEEGEIKVCFSYFSKVALGYGLRWLKTVSSTFQDVDYDGSLLQLFISRCYNHSIKKLPNHW